MVRKRGEFVGLMVERADDNQLQLEKFDSREKDACSRDLWWRKLNVWAFPLGMIIAGTTVSTAVAFAKTIAHRPLKQRCPD